MNVKTFQYLKENQPKDYEVFVIKSDSEFIEGISVHGLPEEAKKDIHRIFKEFEDKLKPYMKDWRRFSKKNIIREYSSTQI
jgi:hypothetical protein